MQLIVIIQCFRINLHISKKQEMALLFISGQEILLILALALIFFGAKSIPEIARVLGKGMREFKKATTEIQKEFENSTSDIQKDIKDVKNTFNNNANQIKRNIEESTKTNN